MNRFILPLVLLFGLIMAGCRPKSADTAHHDESESLGPQYSAKKGLLVPEETRRAIGLKIVEVTEQKVPARIQVQLRVYRVGENNGHASGFVTAEQAAHLKAGQLITIRTGADEIVQGVVSTLDEGLQKAAGMIELLVEMPLTSFRPVIGSFLVASAVLDSRKNVVTIPQSALLASSDGHSVYTVNGEHFLRTPVKVGAASDELVEITDGLYAGDQVVAQPVTSLWLTELAAVKGGQSCCVMPAEGNRP
jgi:multidrug efflux pump subunit AcrA (membrane-fusion protein)